MRCLMTMGGFLSLVLISNTALAQTFNCTLPLDSHFSYSKVTVEILSSTEAKVTFNTTHQGPISDTCLPITDDSSQTFIQCSATHGQIDFVIKGEESSVSHLATGISGAIYEDESEMVCN